MPLINGQKMACAPCIRGHRSTKCNHAAERVMVPVRKPGRPLSTCPCAPGRPCACGGVKVAIPRKQQCSCGPSAGSEPDGIKPEPASEPPSPSRGAFRVQKPVNGHRQNGRKPSFDPANLERMDPGLVNVVGPYGRFDAKQPSVPGGAVTPHIPAAATGGPMGFYPSLSMNNGYRGIDGTNGVGYRAHPTYSMPTFPHQGPLTASPASRGSGTETSRRKRNGSSSTLTATVSNGSGSCCAPSQDLDSEAAETPTEPARASCCCGTKDGSPQLQAASVPLQRPSPANGGYMPQFQPAINAKQQAYPVAFQQPTVFTYPAEYGSWSQPIDPVVWAQLQHAQASAAVFSNMNAMPQPGETPVMGITHNCTCGPGCQCVGCLAHPFNRETLQYVGAAWDYDMGLTAATGAYGTAHTASNGNDTNGDGAQNEHTSGASGQPGRQMQNAAPESPPQAPTPSDASAGSDEQALSTSDYFFVNLPLFPGEDIETSGCGGDRAFCSCGDGCQCDGCTVHQLRSLEPFGS
ncbi:hypothetical protein VTK73DRAFT_8791 [Phialemonium thermophilum]|uniref:Copper-fist domain-containing protein n=1 Tax=Phialemonium thermophilum TaxID=223376 RepID=A0ABR3XMY1_9PEZI